MNKALLHTLILPITLLFIFLSFTAIGQIQTATYRAGELLLMPAGNHSIESIVKDYTSNSDLKINRILSKHMRVWQLEFDPKKCDNEQLLAELRADKRVEIVQNNHLFEPRQTFPDDNVRWAHHNATNDADIDAPEAWDYATGGTNALGDEIVLAIIDGAFALTNHPDHDYWVNTNEIAGNNIDDDGNGYIDDYHGWNAVDNVGTIPDAPGHGHAVASWAGNVGNNGTGNAGVMWDVKLMRVLVFAGINGGGNDEASTIIAADYVMNERMIYDNTNGADGAFIVATNNSYGITGNNTTNPMWCAVYDAMGALGILSCGATTNSDVDVEVVGDLPTACPNDHLISVCNTTINDERVPSGYGPISIDLGAPNGSTSEATPNVTGTIGLLHAAMCSSYATAYKNNPAAVALELKNYILNGVDPLPTLQGLTVTGGRLNAFNSVALMLSDQCGGNFPPVVNFDADVYSICVGESVEFTDESDLLPTVWSWTFSGGTPATSSAQNPTIIYNTPGIYNVSLSATNADGTSSYTSNALIEVVDLTGVAIPYSQDFEGSSDWTVENPNNDDTWAIVPTDACNGMVYGIDNFTNNFNGTQDFLTAAFDLSGYSQVELQFDVAYAQYSDTYNDGLEVTIDGCDAPPMTVYNQSGATLATAPDVTTAFVPADCTEWRTETVDLSVYDGESISINFINNSGWGNWLYLDNISISGFVTFDIKVLLQGCYDVALGEMTTNLGGQIPLIQPYNIAPWSYAGTETLTSIPTDIVDWVLVELRDGTDATTTVMQRAALLRKDGTIVDLDGTSALAFKDLLLDDYYVVVRHRNHLGIMSSGVVALD